MAGIPGGEIRWADLTLVRRHEQASLRPVPILSEEVFNARSGTVIAVVLTSQFPRAGFPLTLELTTPRLPKQSCIKISQVRTLATGANWKAARPGPGPGAGAGARGSERDLGA